MCYFLSTFRALSQAEHIEAEGARSQEAPNMDELIVSLQLFIYLLLHFYPSLWARNELCVMCVLCKMAFLGTARLEEHLLVEGRQTAISQLSLPVVYILSCRRLFRYMSISGVFGFTPALM